MSATSKALNDVRMKKHFSPGQFFFYTRIQLMELNILPVTAIDGTRFTTQLHPEKKKKKQWNKWDFQKRSY